MSKAKDRARAIAGHPFRGTPLDYEPYKHCVKCNHSMPASMADEHAIKCWGQQAYNDWKERERIMGKPVVMSKADIMRHSIKEVVRGEK